jgi:hypothetical protein
MRKKRGLEEKQMRPFSLAICILIGLFSKPQSDAALNQRLERAIQKPS